jgi:hypothetical protein
MPGARRGSCREISVRRAVGLRQPAEAQLAEDHGRALALKEVSLGGVRQIPLGLGLELTLQLPDGLCR